MSFKVSFSYTLRNDKLTGSYSVPMGDTKQMVDLIDKILEAYSDKTPFKMTVENIG